MSTLVLDDDFINGTYVMSNKIIDTFIAVTQEIPSLKQSLTETQATLSIKEDDVWNELKPSLKNITYYNTFKKQIEIFSNENIDRHMHQTN